MQRDPILPLMSGFEKTERACHHSQDFICLCSTHLYPFTPCCELTTRARCTLVYESCQDPSIPGLRTVVLVFVPITSSSGLSDCMMVSAAKNSINRDVLLGCIAVGWDNRKRPDVHVRQAKRRQWMCQLMRCKDRALLTPQRGHCSLK